MATPALISFRGHRAGVNALLSDEAAHPHVVASGSDDGSCRLWDVRTARVAKCLNVRRALGVSSTRELQQQHGRGRGFQAAESAAVDESAVNSMAFGAPGSAFVYVAAGSKVLTFDVRQEALVVDCAAREVLQDNEDEVNTLSRHPARAGKYLSAPDDSGDVRVYDLETHRLFKTLRGQHANICSAAPFRPNGSPWDLVSGGLDGCVLFWDFSRGRLKFKIDLNAGGNGLETQAAGAQLFNPPLVHALAFAPNGRTLAAGLGDGSVAVIDFASRRVLRRLQHHRAAASQVHFPAFRTSEWLLSAGNDASVCVWDYSGAVTRSGEHDLAGDSDAASPDVVKAFDVAHKPNAITTTSHQNLVLVADTTPVIAAYPLL